MIDERFVDVDFKSQFEGGLMGGCLPQDTKLGEACPLFGEVFRDRLIPRSQWDDLLDQLQPNYARHKSWQYNQLREGTCTSNATGGCMSYLMHKQFGIEFSPAPISIYRFCASGPGSGSTTSCNLMRARDKGILLIDTAANRELLEKLGLNQNHVLKATGYSQRFPSGWEETAAHFKIDEFYEINGVDEFFSALLLGFDILYGRDGHAIHGVDVVRYRGSFACKYDNSWGNWGDKGFGYDTYDYLRRKIGRYGAYAMQSLRAPAGIQNVIQAPTPRE